jgi:hypothetical protein
MPRGRKTAAAKTSVFPTRSSVIVGTVGSSVRTSTRSPFFRPGASIAQATVSPFRRVGRLRFRAGLQRVRTEQRPDLRCQGVLVRPLVGETGAKKGGGKGSGCGLLRGAGRGESGRDQQARDGRREQKGTV